MTLLVVVLAGLVIVCVVAFVRWQRRARAVEALVGVSEPVHDAAAAFAAAERAADDAAAEARALALEPLPSLGDGASLHDRVAWADEVLSELRRRADAWRSGTGEDVFAGVRSRLQALTEPADPHAGGRDSLARETAELGLVVDGTGLPSRSDFERLLAAYETDMHALAQELSAALGSAIAAHHRAFVDALEAPAPVERSAGPRELARLQREQLARWRSRTLDRLDSCHARIGEAAQSAIDAYLRGREEMWTELVASAERLKLEAARAIIDADPDDDAMLPVRAAAAFCVVDDVAAGNLERAASGLVLEPPPTTDSTSIEDQLRPVEKLFESLERNSVAWAATNALLLQATAPGGGDALAQSMLGLAGVPENVALAGSDVLSYLHNGAPHDLGLTVSEFASHAIHNLVPAGAADASLPETLLEGVHHAVSGVLDVKGTMIGQLLAHGSFGSAIASYLKSDVLHSGGFFLEQAGQAPQIHDAGGHLLDAADLTGSALHGLVGHLPVVTLVLSTVNEIRVRRDHDASIGDSAANVAIDVVGVGTGMAAAAVAGSVLGIHGGPLVLLTGPGAMAGKLVSNVVKKKRLEKAMAELERVRGVYDQRFSTLVADFSSSVRGTVATQNAKYRRTIGAPPRLHDTAAREVDGLVRSLSAATARYSERTEALLRTVRHALSERDLEGVRRRLEAAEAARVRCDRELAGGDPTAALTSLADAALPYAASWRPSSEYRAACVASAESLSTLEGRHREEIAHWAARTTERFERSKTAITTTVERAATTCIDEINAAAAPVEAAFAVVVRERARLGLAPA